LRKEEILANLKGLVSETKEYADYNPSIFTAEDRDEWAIVFDKMKTGYYN
jgi:hypothetical protein